MPASDHSIETIAVWGGLAIVIAMAGCAGPCPRERPQINAAAAAKVDVDLLERAGAHWKIRRTDRLGNMPQLPSDDVIERMADCKIDEIEATLLVCIDGSGRVIGVEVLAPSLFPSWDAKLLRAVAEQRFVPYEEDDFPRRICFPKTQAFRLDR